MSILDVLIIDDDKETADLFKTVLTQVGFKCEVILNARGALDYLASHVPDMVLLDLRLGIEINGEDILFQIRSNPRFAHTRVIVITAFPHIGDTVTNLADLVLLKPVEVEQLSHLVTRLGDFETVMKKLPFQDPGTLLYNQDFFITRIDLAFERAKRRADFTYAVLVFRINFSGVDMLNLDAQTMFAILSQVVERLQQNFRPTDTIARLSGWKFAILAEELKKPEDIDIIIDRIRKILFEPYQVGEDTYQMEAVFAGRLNTTVYQHSKDILTAAEEALELA